WNIIDGYAVGTAFAPGFPKYVWSDSVRRRGWAMGRRDYIIVGAPWAYLLRMERQDLWRRAGHPRAGTIVYPFHGWEGQNIVGSHEAFVREIQERESGPVTASLYWNGFRRPEIRRAYERAGIRVRAHGLRGDIWSGT